MKGIIERYLDRVMAVASIDDSQSASRIRRELQDHLDQKVHDLREDGMPESEALLKAVEDHGNPVYVGYKLRPWRLVDVRIRGTARGIIAIGPKAHGVVAVGGLAVGLIAFGGVALGAVSFGGMALALLLGWGGCVCAPLAYGGVALGVVAYGGMALGGVAVGGTAAGLWVPGAGHALWSHYSWETVPAFLRGMGEWFSFNPAVPEEVERFRKFSLLSNVLALSILAVGLITQGVLLSFERRRVTQIDPTLCE